MSTNAKRQRFYIGPDEFHEGDTYKFKVEDKWIVYVAKKATKDTRRRPGATLKYERLKFTKKIEVKRILGSTGPFYGYHQIFDVQGEAMYKRYTWKNPFISDDSPKTTNNKNKKKINKKNNKTNKKNNKTNTKNKKNKKSNTKNKNKYNSDSSSESESSSGTNGSDTSSILTSGEELEEDQPKNRFQRKQTLTKQKREQQKSLLDGGELTAAHIAQIKLIRTFLNQCYQSKSVQTAKKHLDIFEETKFVTDFKWKHVNQVYNECIKMMNMKNIEKPKIDKSNPMNVLMYDKNNNNKNDKNDKMYINDTVTENEEDDCVIVGKTNKNDKNDTMNEISSDQEMDDNYYHKEFCVYCYKIFSNVRIHWRNSRDKKHREGMIFICRFPRIFNGEICKAADGELLMCGLSFANITQLSSHHKSQHSLCHRKTRYLSSEVKCRIDSCEQLLQAGWQSNQWKLHCSKHKRKWVPKDAVEQARLTDNIYSDAELDNLYPIDWMIQRKNNKLNNKPIVNNVSNNNKNTNKEPMNEDNDATEEFSKCELSENNYIECGFCHGFFPKDSLLQHMQTHF